MVSRMLIKLTGTAIVPSGWAGIGSSGRRMRHVHSISTLPSRQYASRHGASALIINTVMVWQPMTGMVTSG